MWAWRRPTETGTYQIHGLTHQVLSSDILTLKSLVWQGKKKKVTSLDPIIPNNGNIKAGSRAETARGKASVSQKMATINSVYAHSAS